MGDGTGVNDEMNDSWISFSRFSFAALVLLLTPAHCHTVAGLPETLEWNGAVANVISSPYAVPTMTSVCSGLVRWEYLFRCDFKPGILKRLADTFKR